MPADPKSLVNEGTRGAGTIFKPFDAGAIATQEGKMNLDLFEREQKKKRSLEGGFQATMASIEKFSEQTWEEDLQGYGRLTNDYMDGAAKIYADAYKAGRPLTVMEQYELNRGLQELGQYSATSKANKAVYDDLTKHILKNSDKFDVDASLSKINVGYKDKTLGEREVSDFMVLQAEMPDLLKIANSVNYSAPEYDIEDLSAGKTVTSQTPTLENSLVLAERAIMLDPVSRKYYTDGLEAGAITQEQYQKDIQGMADIIYQNASKGYGVGYTTDARGDAATLKEFDGGFGVGEISYSYKSEEGRDIDVSVDANSYVNIRDPKDALMTVGAVGDQNEYAVSAVINTSGRTVVIKEGNKTTTRKIASKEGAERKFILARKITTWKGGAPVYGNTVLLPYSNQPGTEGFVNREAMKSINPKKYTSKSLEYLDKKIYGEQESGSGSKTYESHSN